MPAMTLSELLCSFSLGWEIAYVWVCVVSGWLDSLPLLPFYLHFYLLDWNISQKPVPDILLLFVIRYLSGICCLADHCKILGPSAVIPFFFLETDFSPLNGFPLPFGAAIHPRSRLCFQCLKTPGSAEVCATGDAKGFSDSMRHLDGKLPSSFPMKLWGFYSHCYTAQIYHNWNKRLGKKHKHLPVKKPLSK